ncbi:MAG: TraR/DksA family transcriptional regulator [Bacteroidetes bacterium]|nr:MAG: TraR/DksA family transcriptional regulator [Bacteroidota bacterium]
MTTEERTILRKKIEETIEKTKTEIAYLVEATKPVAPENAIGRVSRMDAINNKSVAEAGLRSAQKKLAALQQALTKIDSPNFGICSRCGRPIQPARLLFMPQSTCCVRCAGR